MKLTQEQYTLLQAFLQLGEYPKKLAALWGEDKFYRIRSDCRNLGLLAGHDNRLRVTGYGGAMMVHNGYRGALQHMVPHNRSKVGDVIKGDNSADKRAGD